ncbi:hypothetical protein [uncultured Dokdonia sp.]|uniref:hypothetical protein n=1 Tax=uncultured Dokdonia sp. TaxID=575653 RepID=UPI002612616C|nr:hypothetical protein [uncultured Dokdonia sp.]
MSRIAIDISKSKQAGKLVIKRWLLEKITEYCLYAMFVFLLPFIAVMEINSDLNKNESIVLSLLFLVLAITLSSLFMYSIITMNSLKRIHGLSRGKNLNLIKKIAKNHNWNISSTNQQITIIQFSWQETGIDWSKQMTVLYDENDILVNCISFGFGSSPSPFHWFANKRKVDKLKIEFENEIKNHN